MAENTNTTGIPTNEPTISLDALASGGVSPNQETVISRINAEETPTGTQEQIQLEKFAIPEEMQKKEEIALGESGIHFDATQKKRGMNYRRIFVFSLFITIIAGIAALVLSLYNRYLSIASQAIIPAEQQQYIQSYQDIQDFLRNTLGDDTYQGYMSLGLVGPQAQQNLETILQTSKLNYLEKKNIMQSALNQFMPVFIANKTSLEEIKQEISKYGFFSQELFTLLENEENITSIKDSLLSLELIKFSSAINVFSYLDTFVSTVSTLLNLSAQTVQDKMDALTQRGEKDIALYLNNCYLNPYEIDYDCNLVGDFDRYYRLIADDQDSFDRSFFKKIMAYVDAKLEQTELPSFSITFQKFDSSRKQISFNVEVNTFQQDEAALTRRGIINPHIFIVTNLLNLIKQSLFVISENIDAKQLKIVPRVIKIGSTIFTVNNSMMNFVLPVQETTQREISDYTQKDFLDTSP